MMECFGVRARRAGEGFDLAVPVQRKVEQGVLKAHPGHGQTRTRYGYLRIYALLHREGRAVHRKRIDRLYCEMGV